MARIALLLFFFGLEGAALAQAPHVGVEELADNVYLFTYEVHRSLFVATEEGVLATDPQSPEAAKRFVEEIRKVSAAPVRYVVYSHHHDDHASGGNAFGDAVVVAHRAVLGHIEKEIVPPALTFDGSASIYLSGLEVRLLYPGPSETESNVIVYVPERKVAFMVDSVFVKALPWRNMAGADLRKWIAALEELEKLDFQILAPGHGPTGTKSDVRAFITYFQELLDAVQKRIAAGESLAQIQATLDLPKYKDWARYGEHFDLNIEGAYRELTK
jgi:glyoxylase-like metal-dependent hydrolase (beta-lactamase superfamily II)